MVGSLSLEQSYAAKKHRYRTSIRQDIGHSLALAYFQLPYQE